MWTFYIVALSVNLFLINQKLEKLKYTLFINTGYQKGNISIMFQKNKLEHTFIGIANLIKLMTWGAYIHSRPRMDLTNFINDFLNPLLQRKKGKKLFFFFESIIWTY